VLVRIVGRWLEAATGRASATPASGFGRLWNVWYILNENPQADSELSTNEAFKWKQNERVEGFLHQFLGHARYLVYLNNQEAENGSLKSIDLCDQKTAP
jgi:hypothetical protein